MTPQDGGSERGEWGGGEGDGRSETKTTERMIEQGTRGWGWGWGGGVRGGGWQQDGLRHFKGRWQGEAKTGMQEDGRGEDSAKYSRAPKLARALSLRILICTGQKGKL